MLDGGRVGRIGVLAGGPSSEREISLKSGTAVFRALTDSGLNAVFLDIKDKDDLRQILKKREIEVAFIALHGRFGEDGTVQKILEGARIPYTGSGITASRLALDKVASKEMFIKQGIPVPKYAVVEKDKPDPSCANALKWPIVVKPALEGSSIGLSIIRDKSMLGEALDKAFKYGHHVLLEEYVEGRELTVGVIDDKALPVIEIVTKNNVYDFEAKYSDPSTEYLVPAPIEPLLYEKAQRIGVKAHLALGCRSFSRVDMIADSSDNIYVLEVNTIPGMTERSLLPKAANANGMSFHELCVKMVESAVQKKKTEKE